jgi:hypothetical protein
MSEANSKRPVARKSKRTQRTRTGYEIPIPKTKDFDRLLKQVAVKRTKKP